VGKRRLGIVLSEHTDEDGAAIFLQACKMGLDGIVSKGVAWTRSLQCDRRRQS
jgi:ATP-dependent DNA ligase